MSKQLKIKMQYKSLFLNCRASGSTCSSSDIDGLRQSIVIRHTIKLRVILLNLCFTPREHVSDKLP